MFNQFNQNGHFHVKFDQDFGISAMREFFLYYSIRDICVSPGSDNKSYDHIHHTNTQLKYSTQSSSHR